MAGRADLRKPVRFLVLWGTLGALLAGNILVWSGVRHITARWMNVPPAPSAMMAAGAGLGDAALAYRVHGIMIQNFGDTGGRTTPLKDYNYAELARWLERENGLDPRSDFAPYMAAFVFGGTQKPETLGPLIDVLEHAAGDGQGHKWRWLAQAVRLARFRLKDGPRALELANKLAAMYRPDMPLWVRQMPVFVMTEGGDKKAALGLMLSILEAGEGQLQQAEINGTIEYICTRILDPAEAAAEKLCAKTP
jgi:hypothetical protein